MIGEHQSKNKGVLLAVALLGLILGFVFLFAKNPQPQELPDEPGPAATETPTDLETLTWVTYTDPSGSYSFKYPEQLETKYISTEDWPPVVQLTEGAFTCTEAGVSTSRAGVTNKVTIGGKEFCVTQVREGAAGSVYTMYAFATEINGRVPIFTFSLKSVQCANYDEPQRTECDEEGNSFDINQVTGKIVNTFSFN